MLLIFKKGIRCGITHAARRIAKASNKYMTGQLNLDEKSTYLQNLDANNIYKSIILPLKNKPMYNKK